MKRISFILLTLLFLVSCSNDINDAYERSISYHITQDDITSIDGKLTLAFSYEEALKKGISEADYLKAERDLKIFNEYSNKVLRDSLSTRRDDARPMQISYGFLQSPQESTGYDHSELVGLPQGDYILVFQFQSDSYVNHELITEWYGQMPISFFEYTREYQGIDFEWNKSYSIQLDYQCEAFSYGSCFWQLYYIIYVPDDNE